MHPPLAARNAFLRT